MRKPTRLLAMLPAVLLFTVSAADAAHRHRARHVDQRLARLAGEVADTARQVHRTAAGRHGRHTRWGPGGNHGFHGPRSDYTLTLLSNLELRAHAFEDALARRPIVHTRREYEALARAFDRAAEDLYRNRVSPTLERDFECLAEYMYSLAETYEEVAYSRRARDRGDYRGGYGQQGRYDRRVEVQAPRWRIGWRQDVRRDYDRDWDSDSDSDWDSDSDSDSY